MYYFVWNAGLGQGRLRAFHTAELPLALRLVADPEAEDLSKQIAGAWAAFARSGDPNHAGLPRWQRYSLPDRATMLFDGGKSALTHRPAQAEIELLSPFPPGAPFDEE